MENGEHDRSHGPEVAASEMLRRARSDSQEKRDLAIQIFSTATTMTNRQGVFVINDAPQISDN
jgi:hypothetical protein